MAALSPLRSSTVPVRVALAGGLALVLMGAALLGTLHLMSPSSAASPVDQRLVVHPRVTPLHLTLAGTALRGSLSPTIPGVNRLQLSLPAGVSAPSGRLMVVAVMPGMKMAPARGTLVWRRGAYRGRLSLAMFGQYRLRVALPDGRSTALRVTLPLPRW